MMPTRKAVETCLNKAAMCDVARRLGVPQAPHRVVSELQALYTQADDVGFPCVVKSASQLYTVLGQKAIIAHSQHELRTRFPNWPEHVESLLVQGFTVGPRYNMQLLASDGEVLARVVTKTLRTDRPDGTGYTVESITVRPDPVMDQYCRLLVRHLGYTGLGCLQFLVDDAKGTMAFLELNTRLGAAFAVAGVCGVDFPKLAAELALSGAGTNRCSRAYPAGKRIAWSYGDLDGIIRARDAGEIGWPQTRRWLREMTGAFFRADIHVTWSWRDPWPTVATHTRLLMGALRHAVRPRRSAVARRGDREGEPAPPGIQ